MPNSFETAAYESRSLHEQNERFKAMSALENALKQSPDNDALRADRNNMRLALLRTRAGTDPTKEMQLKLKKLHDHSKWEALNEACSLLLKIHPDSVFVLDMLGVAKRELGEFDFAATLHTKALQINPDYAPAYQNCGMLMMELGYFTQAAEFFNKAIVFDETAYEAYTGLGACLWFTGLRKESQEFYEAAERHSHGLTRIKALANLGGVALLKKNFAEGWALRENRLVAINEQARSPANLQKKRWAGQHVSHLLLWAEQGIGDEVMFASCFHELTQFADKITVTANDKLLPLFRRSFPDKFHFISRNNDLKDIEFDAQVPVMTALAAVRQTESDFGKAKIAYLQPDKKRVREVSQKIRFLADNRPIIGLSWSSKAKPFGKHRSIPLVDLVDSLPKESFLVNLQYGEVEAEIIQVFNATGRKVHSVADIDNWQDVDGLAALIAACDRVVSIDNAVVHLAGSIGKVCDVMLPVSADWRWADGGTADSYWYTSLNLHWQKNVGDWRHCLDSLAGTFSN